ncbi:hypothetical protein QTO34_004155 [Cnephaeus nilssonii]|uniref:PiggyBac transposable element-derived protein domain-containing protein n=1 Tax=Cnephaeus nilssonii TaxID=3371016 RepID=A0AA40HS66_CNENI|nr:hypothetical protein QTO34_004155 [Eptesicus nilssonii]
MPKARREKGCSAAPDFILALRHWVSYPQFPTSLKASTEPLHLFLPELFVWLPLRKTNNEGAPVYGLKPLRSQQPRCLSRPDGTGAAGSALLRLWNPAWGPGLCLLREQTLLYQVRKYGRVLDEKLGNQQFSSGHLLAPPASAIGHPEFLLEFLLWVADRAGGRHSDRRVARGNGAGGTLIELAARGNGTGGTRGGRSRWRPEETALRSAGGQRKTGAGASSQTLIKNITDETNEYARHKISQKELSQRSTWNNWKDVTIEEMKAFLGVILNMGVLNHPNLQSYWSMDFESHVPFFLSVFKRERFLQIFWMLHLKNDQKSSKDLRTRTEKGKIHFITYNLKKPTKWGIRLYVLSDSKCGYVHSFVPYYGGITSETLVRPDLPFTSRIVLKLHERLKNSVPGSQGYHFFTDRYYTSVTLAKELFKEKTHLTGTIMPNRKDNPPVIKHPKLMKGEIVAFRDENVMLLAWKDKRIVTMLSTWDTSETESVERRVHGGGKEIVLKPKVATNYTKFMGGVDIADHYTGTYCFMRKTLKWWQKSKEEEERRFIFAKHVNVNQVFMWVPVHYWAIGDCRLREGNQEVGRSACLPVLPPAATHPSSLFAIGQGGCQIRNLFFSIADPPTHNGQSSVVLLYLSGLLLHAKQPILNTSDAESTFHPATTFSQHP